MTNKSKIKFQRDDSKTKTHEPMYDEPGLHFVAMHHEQTDWNKDIKPFFYSQAPADAHKTNAIEVVLKKENIV